MGKRSAGEGGQKSFQQMLSIIGPHRDLWVFAGNNGFGGLHFSKLKPDLFVFVFGLGKNSFVTFTPSNGSLKYQLRSLTVTGDLSIINEHRE